MKRPRIVDAMHYIDDDLVSWAVEYRRAPRTTRLLQKPLLRACVCFLVLALFVLGAALFRGGDHNGASSSFALTAYAVSSESPEVVTAELETGARVPISSFVTDTGVSGFVFSTPNTSSTAPASITVVTNEDDSVSIQEVAGIAIDPTQNYYIVVPEGAEVQMYTVSISSVDWEAELVYEYTLSISQQADTYYAQLVDAVTRDAVVK